MAQFYTGVRVLIPTKWLIFTPALTKDDISPSEISIWLIWKDTAMLDNATRDQELTAFKAELADVLDWETAQISTKEGIIYT